jgi:signal transduction histidine kinase
LAPTALDDNQQTILSGARAASRASAEMLDALLDFSRIEAGIVAVKLCAVPLQPLQRDALHRARRLTESASQMSASGNACASTVVTPARYSAWSSMRRMRLR